MELPARVFLFKKKKREAMKFKLCLCNADIQMYKGAQLRTKKCLLKSTSAACSNMYIEANSTFFKLLLFFSHRNRSI